MIIELYRKHMFLGPTNPGPRWRLSAKGLWVGGTCHGFERWLLSVANFKSQLVWNSLFFDVMSGNLTWPGKSQFWVGGRWFACSDSSFTYFASLPSWDSKSQAWQIWSLNITKQPLHRTFQLSWNPQVHPCSHLLRKQWRLSGWALRHFRRRIFGDPPI